ncbi:MAG: FemAB family PEP-CTERM system-associated protein, partial [Steroidobacteraceae bacterium]|nr:FemAB family PEP-CTERM system-associated protein [Steroidobacteraceae bacterium]MDW8260662.1 FemAB family PEP-CTERM system-associated protein [Gammaproteobacteria bacterium]
SALFGHSLVSTPFAVYGGILAADDAAHRALERAACDLARRLNVDYLEMRNRQRRHSDWPCKDLYVTFRRPIDQDPEQNLLAIPRKQRAMVRKAIKFELRAEIDSDAARHYRIYSTSLRNLGTPVFARRYLDVLRATFGSDCEILTVLHGAEPVASVLSFYFRDEVLPYYGGGTAQARAVAGNDFLYWQVMERARSKGCKIFDFGRSKRDSGSYDFKKNWGFEPEPLFYEYFLVRSAHMPNLSPANPKFTGAIALWRRLPLPLTQLLGPPIAKYLG